MRPIARAAAVALAAVLAVAAGPAAAQDAQPVVSVVRAGSADGTLVFEVVVSEPIPAIAVDTPDPFTVTLFLGGAIFDFPAETRDLALGPLRQVTGAVVARPDGLMGRLDFVLDRPVPYRVRTEGRRLFVHFDLPGLTDAVVFGPGRAEHLEAIASPPAGTPPAAPPATVIASPPAATAPAAPASPPPAASASPPTAAAAPPATPAAPPAAAPSRPATAASPPAAPASPPAAAPSRPATAASRPAAAASPPAAPAPPRAAAPVEPRASRPSAPAASPAPAPAATTARIRRITPVESGEEVRLTVEADRALTPRTFTLSGPPRIVLDFDNVVSEVGAFILALGGRVVERVRASQFRTTPVPIVRVVVDVKRPVPYHVEPGARGTVIHIGAGR